MWRYAAESPVGTQRKSPVLPLGFQALHPSGVEPETFGSEVIGFSVRCVFYQCFCECFCPWQYTESIVSGAGWCTVGVWLVYGFAFVGGPVVQFSGLVWPDEKRVSEPPAHLIFGVASRRAAIMSAEFRAAVQRLQDWCNRNQVIPDDDLKAQAELSNLLAAVDAHIAELGLKVSQAVSGPAFGNLLKVPYHTSWTVHKNQRVSCKVLDVGHEWSIGLRSLVLQASSNSDDWSRPRSWRDWKSLLKLSDDGWRKLRASQPNRVMCAGSQNRGPWRLSRSLCREFGLRLEEFAGD